MDEMHGNREMTRRWFLGTEAREGFSRDVASRKWSQFSLGKYQIPGGGAKTL